MTESGGLDAEELFAAELAEIGLSKSQMLAVMILVAREMRQAERVWRGRLERQAAYRFGGTYRHPLDMD